MLDSRQGGFALIITVSLMVLLALLVVGLLSLSTIALRGSNQAGARAEARANARLALTLAIAQLQEAAGPDQRVTAVADIAAGSDGNRAEAGAGPQNNEGLDGTSKDLSPVQAGTRYWTGVFQNADEPQEIFDKTPTAVTEEWLVSGPTEADRQPGNAACAIGSSGGVADPDRAALLVGRQTAGDGADSLEQHVSAPMVGVRDDRRRTGSFAWWVGDEGVKARLDMRKEPTGENEAPLVVAQRRGWETVSGFSAYPAPTGGADAELPRIASLPSAPLLLAGINEGSPSPLQQIFHSATTRSQGVIVDTLHGGTRVDLSTALSGDLPTNLSQEVYDNDPVADGRVIPATAHPGLERLRWERVRAFHQFHDDLDDGALVVRQGGSDSPTIAPIVFDFRLLMGVGLDRSGRGREEKYQLSGCGKFSVAIANPYNVPLKWDGELEFEVKNMTPLGNLPSRIWQHQACAFIPRDGTPDSPGTESAVFNQAMFTIPEGELEPGEARAYTVADKVVRRNGGANRPVSVELAPFDRASPFDFNNCVEMETDVEVTLPSSMDIRESAQTTLVMLEMRLKGAGGRHTNHLRRYHGFELDNGYFLPNTRRFDRNDAPSLARGPSPIMLYSFQLSQPGMDYEKLMPGGYELGQRASATRTFADFNLQADEWVDAIASYNPPPFFMESNNAISQLGTTPGNTGPGFTRNLAFSPLNWGYSSVEGSTRVVLFDVPEQLTSLAQLQHADLTSDDEHDSVSVQPGNAFANSYFSTFVRRDRTRQQRTDYKLKGSLDLSGAYQTSRNYYDISHILNTALWDRYYFSSLERSSAEPVNPSILVLDPSTPDLGDPVRVTGKLMIDGAFNVNSTDRKAWKAFLASNRHFEGPEDERAEAAFPRTLNQPGGSAIPPSGTDEDSYAGVRRLSDDQIDALAEEMVRQVRLRGPFVSLSHFVNRGLASLNRNRDITRSGALQAAIDESGINLSPDGRSNGFGHLDADADLAVFAWKENAPRADIDGGDRDHRPSDATPREPDWAVTSRDNNFGAVASIVAERDTLQNPRMARELGYRSTGIPGWLTQADVLQVIGASIATRSDTFRIRTMGEARDAAGKVTAVAYCEAIVQRLPEYVDPTNRPHERGDDLTSTNRTYGRRFSIASFRWLSPLEI